MRVVVVESQPHVRAALQFLLAQQADIECVGAFNAVTNLMAKLVLLKPDVILLDWDLPHHQAPKLLGAVHGLPNHPRVVVISSKCEAECAVLAASAAAFVSKCDPPDALLQTLRAAGQPDPSLGVQGEC